MTKSLVTTLACLLHLALCHTIGADDSANLSKTQLQKLRLGTSSAQVELREASDSATFIITGLSNLDRLQKLPLDDLQKTMVVRVHQPGFANNLPSLLGTHSVTETELRFTSRFPLSPSAQYRVELAQDLVTGPYHELTVVFSSLPKKRMPAATVFAVYPSADVLPENLLKFYIYFSAPMSRGEAYERIHLIHDGAEVESPFLELGEELWDAEQKRFTLFVHPGRIKRGLKPREDSGTPMTEGKEYTLRIDAEWLGADRKPLATLFEKKFRVAGADAQQPDSKQWKIGLPKANSKQPVTLTFDEPLDHAMLSRVISVRGASNALLVGSVSVTAHETVWSFEPIEAWMPGTYSIALATNLEDLVGNSLARPFETKELDVESRLNMATEIAIVFNIQ